MPKCRDCVALLAWLNGGSAGVVCRGVLPNAWNAWDDRPTLLTVLPTVTARIVVVHRDSDYSKVSVYKKVTTLACAVLEQCYES